MAPLDRIYLGQTRFSPHTGGNPAEKPVEKLNVDPYALSWEPPVSMGGGVEGKDFGGVGHAWKPGPSYMAASYIASKTTAREATFIPPPHTDYNTVSATSYTAPTYPTNIMRRGKADGIGGEFAAKPPLEARFRSIGGHSSGQYMTALLKMGL